MLPIATYAPPYALRSIIVILIVDAAEYAYNSLAPCRIIPLYSCLTPGKNPGTSTNVIIGILKASQKQTNLLALSLASQSIAPARVLVD